MSKLLELRDPAAAARVAATLTILVDSSPDCLAVLDLDARLDEMTPQGLRLMEVDDFSSIARSGWLDWWTGSDRSAAQEALAAARNGGAGRFQGFCATRKGTPKWWDVIVRPIVGADGRPERLLAVARDVSDMKLAEKAILELNAALSANAEQLKASNKELESFSYSVSHDLRAPLRAIDGFAMMIEEDCAPRLDDEGRRYLSVIRENSKRMGALIDDLLTFSRLGRLPVSTREVDMDSLVREVVAEVLEPHGAARPHIELGTLPPAARRSRAAAAGLGQFARQRGQVLEQGGAAAHRGERPTRRCRELLLGARQRRRLQHGVRGQAVRRLPETASAPTSSPAPESDWRSCTA